MMAIGDEDGAPGHHPLEGGLGRQVVHFPEPVDHPEMVGCDLGRPVPQARLGAAEDLAVGVGIKAEDRA